MLVVAGTISVDPEHFDSFRSAAREMVSASLMVAGCHGYSVSESLTEPGEFNIFEVWQSSAELEAHRATDLMAEFSAKIGELGASNENSHSYEISMISPLATV